MTLFAGCHTMVAIRNSKTISQVAEKGKKKISKERGQGKKTSLKKRSRDKHYGLDRMDRDICGNFYNCCRRPPNYQGVEIEKSGRCFPLDVLRPDFGRFSLDGLRYC